MAAMRGQHLIGKVLGSCVLEKLLGSGGSSAVFLAQQRDPERKVAVKVFLPRANVDIFMQRDFYRRFLREAEATSKLEHANITPIYAYGEQDGLPYIVMPYMPGGTFAEYLAGRGPLSLREAQWYLEQLTEALDFAHAHGFVHCDVKPANILLDSDGLVMLSDFGIARSFHTEELNRGDHNIRRQEAVFGTPDYISPEQALGRALDGRSDIYSLGVTLFFVLAKRLPFQAADPIALALLHVHESPPSLALMRGDITPALDRVISKALAKNPDDRYQTAKAFSDAFSYALVEGERRSTFTVMSDPALIDEDDALTGPQPVLLASPSIVRVRPVRSSARILYRIFFIGLALIIIAATTSFTLTSLNKQQPGVRLESKPTATSPPELANYFSDQEHWPRSQLYFFDQALRYHMVKNQAKGVAFAVYDAQQFQDFRLSVDVMEVQMHDDRLDYQGVVFRVTPDQAHYYLLEIAPGENHSVVFFRYDNGIYTYISNGTFAASRTPGETTNTITIVARGNSFQFLVNGQPVFHDPVTDPGASPLLSGQIGCYLEDQGEVAFSHLSITYLP